RSPEDAELRGIAHALRTKETAVEQRVVGPVRTLVLTKKDHEFGRIDFAEAPYPRAEKPVDWHGVRVESLLDMTINKVQTILTRFKARDFVDLFFLLR